MRLSSTFAASALGMTVAVGAGLRAPLPQPATASADPASSASSSAAIATKPPVATLTRFEKPGAVRLEARLGHPTLARDSDGQTYMMVSLHGGDQTSAAPPPVRLGIVIDRSGSMRGARMSNAILAASSVIQRLRDVDTLTVVSFDTKSQVVVPPTRMSDASRAQILSAVRAIPVGGDTCISCGLEEAMHQIASLDDGSSSRSSGAPDQVRRMMLLSDGATNHGIRDLPGLRALADRSRDEGCAISTVGLDVDFDEKVMGALASESNGKHYFVRNAPDLSTIFGEELSALKNTVAGNAEVTVDLAPGVSVDEVLDRSFTRVGTSQVRIPFGSVSAHEDRTLLVKLHVPTGDLGSLPVAHVSLHYRDLGAAADAASDGDLALDVGTTTSDPDPIVEARVDRSRTAQTLTDANDLLSKGRPADAANLLDAQAKSLAPHKSDALHHAVGALGKDRATIEDDFDGQIAALSAARRVTQPTLAAASATPSSAGGGGAASNGGFFAQGAPMATAVPAKPAPPPAAAPDVKASIRANQEKANAMRF